MKARLLLLFIILFGFFIRVYQVGKIPSGFYSDEALTGFEAYSILKTGRDQYGTLFPAVFRAFGDYRPGLFIYATVPFVQFFGLNEWAVRMPSVIFSSATILVVYALGRELFRRERVALFSALLLAVSPWSIQFARMSHDTNLATFLVSFAILLFIKHKKKPIFIVGALFLFALSLYAYYTPRVFVLAFFGALFVFKRTLFVNSKKIYSVSIVLVLLTLLPLFITLTNRETGWSRVDAVSIWGDSGIGARTEEFYREDTIVQEYNSRLFHNKVVEGGKAFVSSFLSHFEPSFLFFNGDPIKIYNTPGNGILFFIEPLLLVVAIAYLIRRGHEYNALFVVWLFASLLPDSLTRLAPAAARVHLILPMVSILGGLGLWRLMVWSKSLRLLPRIGTVGIFSGLLIYNHLYFMHNNLVHVPLRYAQEWHYGLRELIPQVAVLASQYEKVWVAKSAWGWINFAFYLKYPPESLQQEIKLSEKNEFGLGWVYGFDRYYFDDFLPQLPQNQNILYVGAPGDFPKNVIPKLTVFYPDKSPAFYVVEAPEFQRARAQQVKEGISNE